MKNQIASAAAIFIFLLGSPVARAQNLYYNPAAASGASWFAANQWNDTGFSDPFDQTWVDGNFANFNFSAIKIVAIDSADVAVAGLVNNSATEAWISSGSSKAVVFDGGSISGAFNIRGSANLSGTIEKTGGALVYMEQGTGTFSGTYTNQAGTSRFNPAALSASSNFVVNAGTLGFQAGDTYAAVGSMTVNGGEMSVGRFSGTAVSVTISSLSGTGGTILPRLGSASNISSLIVNQASNTTYSGTVAGVSIFTGTNYLAFTKSGTGSLTLNGSTVNLRQGTTVSGGTLLLNGGSTRNFENLSGSNAITVANQGSLGGTSTISVHGGDSVLVQDGGSLAAGNGIGTAGRTIFTFIAGGSLDLGGVTTGSNWLHFDLGALTTPGTTYDQIRVTNGTLSIGTGLLNFNDFAFNALAGIEEGTYVLFDLTGSSSLSGTLGSSLSGGIGVGYSGTLSQSGNNIVLEVVPDPGSAVLSVLGLGLVSLFVRRKRSLRGLSA